MKNGKGSCLHLSECQCWRKTSKGIKNLRNSRCGLHLFNGIGIGRQTEYGKGLSKAV